MIPTEPAIDLNMTSDKLYQLQQKEPFCTRIWKQLQAVKLQSGNSFFIKDSLLTRYVLDNKQTFQAVAQVCHLRC